MPGVWPHTCLSLWTAPCVPPPLPPTSPCCKPQAATSRAEHTSLAAFHVADDAVDRGRVAKAPKMPASAPHESAHKRLGGTRLRAIASARADERTRDESGAAVRLPTS